MFIEVKVKKLPFILPTCVYLAIHNRGWWKRKFWDSFWILVETQLGADLADGVDIDPVAISTARQNAALNNITPGKMRLCLVRDNHPTSNNRICKDERGRISHDLGFMLEEEKYDIVIANILLNPLLELADKIVSYAKPGATVGVSGILSEQVCIIPMLVSLFLNHGWSSRVLLWYTYGYDSNVILRLCRFHSSLVDIQLSWKIYQSWNWMTGHVWVGGGRSIWPVAIVLPNSLHPRKCTKSTLQLWSIIFNVMHCAGSSMLGSPAKVTLLTDWLGKSCEREIFIGWCPSMVHPRGDPRRYVPLLRDRAPPSNILRASSKVWPSHFRTRHSGTTSGRGLYVLSPTWHRRTCRPLSGSAVHSPARPFFKRRREKIMLVDSRRHQRGLVEPTT